jgi:hypothetical protein
MIWSRTIETQSFGVGDHAKVPRLGKTPSLEPIASSSA